MVCCFARILAIGKQLAYHRRCFPLQTIRRDAASQVFLAPSIDSPFRSRRHSVSWRLSSSFKTPSQSRSIQGIALESIPKNKLAKLRTSRPELWSLYVIRSFVASNSTVRSITIGLSRFNGCALLHEGKWRSCLRSKFVNRSGLLDDHFNLILLAISFVGFRATPA